MRKLFIIIMGAIPFSLSLTQPVMQVTTDKSVYEYGEPIEVSVSVTNNSDSSFSLWGSSSCVTMIGFNEVKFLIMCTDDYYRFYFAPLTERKWTRRLLPAELGIPDKNGEQLISATVYGFAADTFGQDMQKLNIQDSIYITAQKYYGGVLSVGIRLSAPAEDVQRLRDSINATVVSSYTLPISDLIIEHWSISGYDIDSLVEVYSNDYRLARLEVERILPEASHEITMIEEPASSVAQYFISQNYPNPFNPATIISYRIPTRCMVTLKLFDVTGREVASLVNEEKPSGSYEVEFNASGLTSGIYFYRLNAGSFSDTKKLVLIR